MKSSAQKRIPASARTARCQTVTMDSTFTVHLQVRGGHRIHAQADHLAVEEPLEIRVRGRSVAVTMRTPGHDAELAAGFLFTEDVIRERRQLVDVQSCSSSIEPQNTVNVFLRADARVDFDRLTRHVFATSSCGLCGKASIEAVRHRFPPVASGLVVHEKVLLQLPARMRRAQPVFARTGGLHAAGLFDVTGELLVAREDIGRHNAVDKVLGWGLWHDKLPFDAHILLVSGRASFEIMQKALAARVPVICAVSAPSSLAVEFAQKNRQTLVGFLRDSRMNVYSHPERVASDRKHY